MTSPAQDELEASVKSRRHRAKVMIPSPLQKVREEREGTGRGCGAALGYPPLGGNMQLGE